MLLNTCAGAGLDAQKIQKQNIPTPPPIKDLFKGKPV